MLVLKCLRPDKVTNAMQLYLAKYLGQEFIEPQTAELSAIYSESSPTTPIVFILSTGTDPAAELYKFADRLKMTAKLRAISLGQGQGPKAEAMLKLSAEQGYWCFFQVWIFLQWMANCDATNFSPDSRKNLLSICLTVVWQTIYIDRLHFLFNYI